MNPPVDENKHYKQHPSGIECIEVTRHFNNNLGNVIKYIWRAGHKQCNPTIRDLQKANYYILDEIARLNEISRQAFPTE